MNSARQYAAHAVKDGDNLLEPGVVEVAEGYAKAAYRLVGEQPHTIWLGGTIEIKVDGQGCRTAYHNGKPIN